MLAQLTAIWTELVAFLVTLFPAIEGIFVKSGANGTELTYVGLLCAIGLGVSMILLVFNLVRSFLYARP